MANGSQFSIDVVAALNTNNIPKELKDLNAKLTKDTTNVIKIPIGIDAKSGKKIFQELIKDVRTYKDELNNTFKRTTIIDPFSGLVKSDKITQITEAIKTLTTETHKWTTSSGDINTWTTSINSAGETVQTRSKQYVTNMGEMITETSNWGRNAKGQWTQVGDTIKKTTDLIKDTTTSTTTQFGKITDTVNGVTKTYEGLITTTQKVSSNGEELTTVFSKYTNELGQVVTKTEVFNKQGVQVATTERNISKEAVNSAKGVNTLSNSLGGAFERLARYYIASLPIQAVRKVISETITTVKEFDSALIEFRKVSDLAGESLTNYTQKLAKMGELTGSTMQAMVEASTEFRKSGFNDEDSAKLASIAEMYRNIADEELTAGEAASFIIAQMKAFNIEAGQAEHIIDAVNEVANNFSVSSADLAKNLGNMSAIMAINNVSLEEQIGMLTGVTEITRNASSASRGLVMISSRLTQVLDDTSSTGKKLTAIYDKLGIALKDENGQLRGHYEILGDLASQWDSLSENEQKYIALTSAGARQQQNFVSLMENWGQVAKATTTAYQSMGSAQKENEKVMDSVAKKVEILRSKFQQLVIGEGGLQELAKLFLNLGIGLLNFANSDVGKVIIETTLLMTTFGLLTKGLESLSKSIIVNNLLLKGWTKDAAQASVAGLGFTASIKQATKALLENAIAFATSPMGLVAILLAGITAAAIAGEKALEKYRKRLQTANDKLKELSESTKDTESELDNLNDTLKSVQDQIKNNNKTKLKITDSNELSILDKENEKLVRQEETLKRQIILQERKLELARQEAELQARETLKTTTESKIKTSEVVDSFSGAGTGEYIGVTVTPTEELQLAIDKYKELKEAAKDLQDQIDNTDPKSEEWEKLNSKLEDTQSEMENVQSRGLEMSDIILNAADNINSTNGATLQYKDSLYDLVDSLYEVTGAEKAVNDSQEKTIEELEEEAEAAQEISEEIDKMADSLGITATELAGLRSKFDDLTLHTFLSQLTEARQKISDTNTVIDNLQNALSTAQGALDEYNQTGYLTIDTFQGLMNISAQYLAALVNENGQLEINQNSLSKLVDELKIAKIEELADAAAMEILALRQEESATTANSAQTAVDAAGDAFTRAGDKASRASAGIALFNAELAKATGGALGSFSAQEKAIVNKYKNLAKEISTLTVNTTKAGNAASSAGKKGAGAAKQAKDATKELNKELEDTLNKYKKVISWISKQYDKEIDKIKKSEKEALEAEESKIKAKEKEKDNALDAIEKEINALEKEKKALKEQKEALDDRKSALKEEEDAILDSIEKRIKALEKERDAIIEPIEAKIKALEKERDAIIEPIEAKIKALEKERDAIINSTENRIDILEKERDAIIDATQAEIDSINELKEARQNYWDEQIDALKNANKELKENLELQEKLDALEKARNTKVKIYKEGQGFVYDVDQGAVAEAQKALDEYLSQKAYEDELARLEALKDAEINNYNDRLKELNNYKDNTKKTYDKQLNDLKEYKDNTKKTHDKQIDDLKEYKDNTKKAYDEQTDDLKEYKDNTKEYYNEQVENLKEYKESVQEQYEEKIKILEKDIDALEKHMDELDKHKESLEEHKDAVQEAYEAEIEELENHKESVQEAYEAEIETWEGYKQAFEDMVNAYEEQQNRLLFQQLTGITDESNNWMTRLDNLAEFVRKYNELQAQLNTGNTDVSNNASMSSGSAPSGGYNGGGSSTRTVTNYSKPSGATNYTPTYNTNYRKSGIQSALSHQGYHGMPTNVKRYASGTGSIKNDEIAIVGENPNKEIVLGSKINNGELMSLGKGTGIVNADSSKTLASMLNQVGQFGSSGFGSGSGTLNNNINNDSLVVNGVTIEGSNISEPQTFVNGLLNLKAEALQRAYKHR